MLKRGKGLPSPDVRESHIESYFLRLLKTKGGEARKVQWVGRRNAPDRRVMLPGRPPFWVEFKSTKTIKAFPGDAHERAQYREHERMRRLGETVYAVGTRGQVDELLT